MRGESVAANQPYMRGGLSSIGDVTAWKAPTTFFVVIRYFAWAGF